VHPQGLSVVFAMMKRLRRGCDKMFVLFAGLWRDIVLYIDAVFN